MTKSLFTLFLLTTIFTAACASTGASNPSTEKFAADDCRAITTLFRDQNMNDALMGDQFQNDFEAEKSKDKFTWPWGGGRHEDKISRERAAMRKAHNRKTCAQ